MPDTTDSSKLNPQVRTTDIGKRTLRKIPIYPLALADQLNLTDLISKGVNAFFEMSASEDENESMMQFISFALGLLKDNIDRIVEMLTDEGKEVLKDITNVQLMEIVEIVYVENFEGPAGKAMSLFGKERPTENELPSKKPLPRVARSIPTRSTVSSN